MDKLKFEQPIIKRLHTGMPNKFGMRTEYDPITKIEGVEISGIMQKYGSPVFVVSERTIRTSFHEAKRAFETRYPRVQFAWSYKTNYLDAVCRVFHQEGSWAEVVSRFEYEKALLNGVDGKHILVNGPDKSRDDLEIYIKNASYIHIDNFDELFDIIELSDKMKIKARVAIRVNMDTGIYPQWQRFGFNYENGEAWQAINRIMLCPNMELAGLHCHIGTYILSAQAYGVAATKLADLAVNVKRKFNQNIGYIDLGGGFASKNTLKGAYLSGTDTCPSYDDYADAITSALLRAELDPGNMPVLFLETGRALIDDAGFLLTSVMAGKRLADGRKAIIIDAGVNLLFTSFWYDHKITPAQSFGSGSEEVAIYGPLCMNIDVIRESVTLPVLKKGDKMVISRVGAYNMTQWMQFITLRPKIVMLDRDGNTHIIRQNETTQDVKASELVPNYLMEHKL